MNDWKNRISVSTKVVLFVVLLILPLNMIALSVSNASINTAVEKLNVTEQSLADIYMSNLNMRMKNAASLLNYCITKDANCIRMIQQEGAGYSYDSAKMKFFSSFSRLADVTDGADGYYFYMSRMEDSLIYGTVSITAEVKEYLATDIFNETQDYGWRIHRIGASQYLYATYNINNVLFGAWIDLETIKSDIISVITYDSTLIDFSDKAESGQGDGKIRITSSIGKINLNINHDRGEMLKQISPRQKALQVLAILYLIAIPLLYVFLRYQLIKPLGKINHAHRELQKGNLDYRISDKGGSAEYAEAFQSFNLMADKLNAYRIEVYENEIARQKMELRNLQLQIRPHFLLNTFNLIHTLVQKKQNQYVETIIIYLSKYFRYIFRSDNDLESFDKELEIISDYAKIASIRYKNMVEVDIDIDPAVRKVQTPPLLIHNFVENSVKHGIKQGQVLHISLHGTYCDGIATFRIHDDGNGMDRKTLERTRSVLNGEIEVEEQHSHIGLYNSYKRLRWYYGEKARIEVDSEPGVMTDFIIQFPCELEDDNESADSE